MHPFGSLGAASERASERNKRRAPRKRRGCQRRERGPRRRLRGKKKLQSKDGALASKSRLCSESLFSHIMVLHVDAVRVVQDARRQAQLTTASVAHKRTEQKEAFIGRSATFFFFCLWISVGEFACQEPALSASCCSFCDTSTRAIDAGISVHHTIVDGRTKEELSRG